MAEAEVQTSHERLDIYYKGKQSGAGRFGESTASPLALLTFIGRNLPQEASTVESNQNSSVSVLADPDPP